MTADHDPEEERAQNMRELAIRLLFETDPKKQEALVAQLAAIAKVQRGPSRAA